MRALCALVLVVCVSALCFTASAQFDQSFIGFPSNDALMASYVDRSASLVSPIAQLRVKDQLGNDDKKKKCGECVKGVAKHLLNSTWDFIEKACQNASEPLHKKICKFIESHKEEETGYLIVRTRPGTYGYAYCSGAGKCPVHPNATLSDISLSYSGESPDYYELDDWKQIVNDALLMEQFYTQSQRDSSMRSFESMADSVAVYADEKFDKLQRKVAKLGREGDDSKGNKKCHKCLHKGVKCVLKIATFAVHRKCEHTKCPHVKKVCEWIGRHKQLFRGMLYGHIEPYKFAAGYCAGNRQCKRKKQSAGETFAEVWENEKSNDDDE